MMLSTFSRTRQECMNRLSKTHAVGIQPQPEQMAVDAGEFAQTVRKYRARGGTSMFIDGFDRLAISLSVDELQMPQMRSAT